MGEILLISHPPQICLDLVVWAWHLWGTDLVLGRPAKANSAFSLSFPQLISPFPLTIMRKLFSWDRFLAAINPCSVILDWLTCESFRIQLKDWCFWRLSKPSQKNPYLLFCFYRLLFKVVNPLWQRSRRGIKKGLKRLPRLGKLRFRREWPQTFEFYFEKKSNWAFVKISWRTSITSQFGCAFLLPDWPTWVRECSSILVKALEGFDASFKVGN